jgi:hypothetical protein
LDIIPYEIYAKAKLAESDNKSAFKDAYAEAFRAVVGNYDDITAAKLNDTIGSPREPYGPRLEEMQADLNDAVARQKNDNTIKLNDALDLVPANN